MHAVVGLGGSAGSISALQAFFSRMPENSGPGKNLLMTDGQLVLNDLRHDNGTRSAVDIFFRTLADTHGPRSTAIVLSGSGGDGAIGIKRIKENGGLTVVQAPGEAEHDGMPRSAIATGMVDWVLPVAEMPNRLLEYHSPNASAERVGNRSTTWLRSKINQYGAEGLALTPRPVIYAEDADHPGQSRPTCRSFDSTDQRVRAERHPEPAHQALAGTSSLPGRDPPQR